MTIAMIPLEGMPPAGFDSFSMTDLYAQGRHALGSGPRRAEGIPQTGRPAAMIYFFHSERESIFFFDWTSTA
jgi:hypothetical protein